jgi:hypothetical protein
LGIVGASAQGVAATAAASSSAEEKNVWKYIQIHAWLLWASMGFLFPLGAILVRYNRNQRNPTVMVSPAREHLLLYVHIIVQCAAVGTATAGIAVLIKQFGATFYHTHMRLGLALWIIVMMLPFMSIVRPAKGTPWRSYWYFIHWLLGTGVLVLGVVNCFIGINIYQHAHGSIKALNIAFTVQVAVMAFIYFLQDRWSYVLAEGSRVNYTLPTKGGTYRDIQINALATP